MKREKELLGRMAGTIVTIVICLAAMGFSAFAYFSHSISSGINVIQSAHFDVIVTDMTSVKDSTDEEGSEVKTYTFKIQPDGNAETGYCKIVISKGNVSKTFYTTQLFLAAGENNDRLTELILQIKVPEGCKITFTPQWGTSSYYSVDQNALYGVEGMGVIDCSEMTEGDETVGGSENLSGNDDISQTDDNAPSSGDVETYTIVKDDTLWSIAQQYNVKWENIAAYNLIEDEDDIHPGQVILIPPSDWEVPGESVESTEAESTTAPTEATEAEVTTAPTEATEAEATTAPTEVTEAAEEVPTTAPAESSSPAVE